MCLLWGNMAACYMQMAFSEHPRAIHECNLALEVTPKYKVVKEKKHKKSKKVEKLVEEKVEDKKLKDSVEQKKAVNKSKEKLEDMEDGDNNVEPRKEGCCEQIQKEGGQGKH
ncbi:hypothetical protein K1719_013259 [Acacia pycnantha]|nr:hypothetical protein K1719_013259 [Acacia pycnantha]